MPQLWTKFVIDSWQALSVLRSRENVSISSKVIRKKEEKETCNWAGFVVNYLKKLGFKIRDKVVLIRLCFQF
jgi:hypothetical protein